MNAKNILKTLAFALLLTTACSREVINDDNTAKKGLTLPVTVNVTRQGDDSATKATYNETSKTLEFSAGDQLFVCGNNEDGAGLFAGTLSYVSGGTFSGTIDVENGEYSGTAIELFTAASDTENPDSNDRIQAFLLPNGYETYGFIYYLNNVYDGYSALSDFDENKAFALSKATAVEQFSCEYSDKYDSGFALSPLCAILNFTITGLSASTTVDVSLTNPEIFSINKTVTTDESGTASFAVGVWCYTDLMDLSLTVGGYAINLTSSSKELEAGHIYNITRRAPILTLTSPAVGQVIGSDGLNYVYDSSAPNKGMPTGVTAVAKICYVRSNGHGLALALADEGQMYWSPAKAACEGHKPILAGGTWKLASQSEWADMMVAAGEDYDLRDGFSSVGGTNMMSEAYWSSTESANGFVSCWDFGSDNGWYIIPIYAENIYARACLAF